MSLTKWCKLLPATLKGRLHEELATVKGSRHFDAITELQSRQEGETQSLRELKFMSFYFFQSVHLGRLFI